jgi:hypothetical protein
MTAAEFTAVAMALILSRNLSKTGATQGRTAADNRSDLEPARLKNAFSALRKPEPTNPVEVISDVIAALATVGVMVG